MPISKSLRVDDVLWWVVVWCVFSIKITLVPLGETGIRADDFFILVVALLLFIRGDYFKYPFSKAVKCYFAFIVVALASSFWNGYQGRVSTFYSLVFDARLVQYTVFYFIGYSLARAGKDISRILIAYIAVLVIIVPLQMARLIPTASLFSESRASGNTNGPYELAAVAGCLLCYLGYKERKKIWGISAVALVLLTASRTTTFGVSLTLLRQLARLGRSGVKNFVLAIALGLALLLVALGLTVSSSGSSTGTVFDRMSSAFKTISIDRIEAIYGAVPAVKSASDYQQGVFSYNCGLGCTSLGDASSLYRMIRWSTLIKSATSSSDSIWIGLGPSFGTEAVDGYYVRVYAETGILGLAVFGLVVWSLWNSGNGQEWAFQQYIFIMLMTAIFIDIFTSYKPMLLLWLWHGANHYQAGLTSRSAAKAS